MVLSPLRFFLVMFLVLSARRQWRAIAEGEGDREWAEEQYIAACQDLSEIRTAVLKFMGRVP